MRALPLPFRRALQFAQWLLGQKLAMATAAVAGYAAAGGAGPGMLAPAYMQQQVAGTTYFHQAMMAPGHLSYSPQAMAAGMPAYALPHPAQQLAGQHMRVVAMGMSPPLSVPVRGRAPA
jgi:hypothetical protein